MYGEQSGRTERLSNIDDGIRRSTRKTLIEDLLRSGGQRAFWDEQTHGEAYKHDQQAPGCTVAGRRLARHITAIIKLARQRVRQRIMTWADNFESGRSTDSKQNQKRFTSMLALTTSVKLISHWLTGNMPNCMLISKTIAIYSFGHTYYSI